MASLIDMSLDDIIQKKKKQNPRKPRPKRPVIQPSPSKKNLPIQTKKLSISDARNKIISKKRTQITDAREKLAELAKQKDARLKLEKLRQERMTKPQAQGRMPFSNRGFFLRAVQSKERVFVDPSRQVAYGQPIVAGRNMNRRPITTKKYLESRSIGMRQDRVLPKPKPIIRTVENDIEIIDDPMGDEYIPTKAQLHNRKASLQLKIIAHNNDVERTCNRTLMTEREKSPPRPPSILKKRPMAASRLEDKPVMEYRIIVSNLRNTVTGGDIEELFGDVGGMMESRLVRPGTAEVIYKTQEDAQKAVELYHNRQLDGQPMNCLLVTPRTPAAMQRNSSKPALYSTNSNVEPDISTFHKVLFSNL